RPRVLLVADPRERGLQQPDHRGEDLLARQPGEAQVVLDPLADPREGGGEGEQAVVFRLVARLAPARVVAVLLAALRVPAGRLEMPARTGADPDVRPGGRDGERLDTVNLLRVAHRPALVIDVAETGRGPPAPDARHHVA